MGAGTGKRMKKDKKWRDKYIPRKDREYFDKLYVPYNPDNARMRQERQSLMDDLAAEGWKEIDACRVPDFHKQGYRFFWVMQRDSMALPVKDVKERKKKSVRKLDKLIKQVKDQVDIYNKDKGE